MEDHLAKVWMPRIEVNLPQTAFKGGVQATPDSPAKLAARLTEIKVAGAK